MAETGYWEALVVNGSGVRSKVQVRIDGTRLLINWDGSVKSEELKVTRIRSNVVDRFTVRIIPTDSKKDFEVRFYHVDDAVNFKRAFIRAIKLSSVQKLDQLSSHPSFGNIITRQKGHTVGGSATLPTRRSPKASGGGRPNHIRQRSTSVTLQVMRKKAFSNADEELPDLGGVDIDSIEEARDNELSEMGALDRDSKADSYNIPSPPSPTARENLAVLEQQAAMLSKLHTTSSPPSSSPPSSTHNSNQSKRKITSKTGVDGLLTRGPRGLDHEITNNNHLDNNNNLDKNNLHDNNIHNNNLDQKITNNNPPVKCSTSAPKTSNPNHKPSPPHGKVSDPKLKPSPHQKLPSSSPLPTQQQQHLQQHQQQQQQQQQQQHQQRPTSLSIGITSARLGSDPYAHYKDAYVIMSLHDPDGNPKFREFETYRVNGSSPLAWDEKDCTVKSWDSRAKPGDFVLFFVMLKERKICKAYVKLGRDVKSGQPYFRWLPLADPNNPNWQVDDASAIGYLCVRISFTSSDSFAFRKDYQSGKHVEFKLNHPKLADPEPGCTACMGCMVRISRLFTRREG